jgi:dihydrofolate reductase
MGSIVNSTFVSLDGVQCGDRMDAWHFDYVDDELGAITREELFASDAMLMGRGTYDAYAAVWPTRSDEYSDRINSLPKYVVSSTLTAPEWTNTTVLDGDLIAAASQLKADNNLLMHGYGSIAKSLLREGLLDELHLWVHPKLAGVGETSALVFEPGLNVALQLADVRRLGSGVVLLSYTTE